MILDEDELAAAEPERSRYIEITDFVSLHEIDPVYFNTTYYLAPEGETAGKAYALLRQAMQDSGKVAIATFVILGWTGLRIAGRAEDRFSCLVATAISCSIV